MSREMKSTELEWLGDIPNDWETIPNKHLMKKKKELCPKFNGEDILSLSMRGIYVRDPNDESGKRPATYDGYQYVNEGDLLMCLFDIDVTPRCVGRVYDNGLTSPAYSRMVMNPKRANVDYYYYYYLALDFDKTLLHLSKNMRSSLTEVDFGGIKAPVPPVSEQRQIVSFLDRKCSAIDTAIEKIKKSIEKLEEYKKAVITKAVTKGLDPDAKMKDSGVEWIGEVPETWDVKQLRKFYSRRLNKNKNLQEQNLLSLSYGNIIRKNIDTKEGLLPESFDGYNIVEANDIVIRGTDLQNDHKSLRTGLVTERGIITSAYMTLKPKAGVNSEYYHYLLHCYDIEKVFYSMGGGLRQSLDYWDFIRTYVLVPSEQEQRNIVEFINNKCGSIDALIAKKQETVGKWEEYKKSLIYYAVTGKIDCRNEVI